MKSLIKQLLREGLDEAIKNQPHWGERYNERMLQATIKDMDPKHKLEIDKRIKFIESLEFDPNDENRVGIWLYKTGDFVKHHPWKDRDKGKYLFLIVKENIIKTFFWKHEMQGLSEIKIIYSDLVELSKSDNYNPQTKPISKKSIEKWINVKNTPQNVNPDEMKFKSHKDLMAGEGNHIWYVADKKNFIVRTVNNDKKTGNPKTYQVDDVLEVLPKDIQDFLFN